VNTMASTFKKTETEKGDGTDLSGVADVLERFDPHGRPDGVGNTDAPVLPQRRVTCGATPTRPQFDHCANQPEVNHHRLERHRSCAKCNCSTTQRGRGRGAGRSLMKDKTKQTTFCAKLRNARWSNRRASGPNRFVDLDRERAGISHGLRRVALDRARRGEAREMGCLQSLLEDALGDVRRPDPGDADDEHGHARRHAAAAASGITGAGADAAAAAAPARGYHGVDSPAGGGEVRSTESRRGRVGDSAGSGSACYKWGHNRGKERRASEW
jgi:hypothetical protein